MAKAQNKKTHADQERETNGYREKMIRQLIALRYTTDKRMVATSVFCTALQKGGLVDGDGRNW